MARDRRATIQQPGAVLNGIDFVEIASPDQRVLQVHFLNGVALAGSLKSLSIDGGDAVPQVPIQPINDSTDWSSDGEGRLILTVSCRTPGDFSFYTLSIQSPLLDTPGFNQSKFSFKAACPSSLDCKIPTVNCPIPAGSSPLIDYLAKDFAGFRKALFDFAALRYPDWRERAEADLGVVIVELLAAVADDLSYTQDRVATEAFFETATERLSLTRHARLVDYEPSPARSSSVWLRIEVSTSCGLPAGLLLSTAAADGSEIFFELGTGLSDTANYPASRNWNRLQPYWLDDGDRCLDVGSTSMLIDGHGHSFYSGQGLLIETDAGKGEQPIRQLVRLADPPALEMTDFLFSRPFTRVEWNSEDRLTQHHDLTMTAVNGNVAPATQGRRFVETFAIEEAPLSAPQTPTAVCRTGPRSTPNYRYTLGRRPLAWLNTAQGPRPEIALHDSKEKWQWRRWLLDTSNLESAFTVDAALYSRIAGNSDGSTQYEYDGGQGATLRFGDGQFANIPEPQSLFEVKYRSGGGAMGNVAPDSAWRTDGSVPIISVSNPFAAAGGTDEESPLSVRRRAPHAFQQVQFRAVRGEDYETAASTLPWVQQAGTAFRWTGSWTTVFTTPDVADAPMLSRGRRIELLNLLNRYRMAGYESYVDGPVYAALDLRIKVCARADAYRGDVLAAVTGGLKAFFGLDRFTFGQALERSALETAIQDTPGVGGVLEILFRRRDVNSKFANLPQVQPVSSGEIILVENNSNHPERGSFRVEVMGGK